MIRVQLAISDLLLSPTSVRFPFPLDLLTLPERVPQEFSRGKRDPFLFLSLSVCMLDIVYNLIISPILFSFQYFFFLIFTQRFFHIFFFCFYLLPFLFYLLFSLRCYCWISFSDLRQRETAWLLLTPSSFFGTCYHHRSCRSLRKKANKNKYLNSVALLVCVCV